MRKTGKNKKKTAGFIESKSTLLTLLYHGLDKLAQACSKSAIVRFFGNYDQVEEYSESSLLIGGGRNLLRGIRKKISRKPRRELGTEQISPREVGIFAPSSLPRSFKNRIGQAMEESVVLGKASNLLKEFLYVPMMSYGVFLFSFGLFTTAMQALLYFWLRQSDAAALDLFVGLALVLLSLPIMFRGYEPLADSFRESRIGSLILRALQGRTISADPQKKRQPAFLFFLGGMIGGLLTFTMPPLNLLVLIALVIAAICVLYVPEAGVCMVLFMLPFFTDVSHASVWCALAILYIGLCLLFKVLVGKRSITFNTMDGLVLLFGLIVLSTGIGTGRASGQSALLYAALISGYFVLANLLRSEAWIRRSISSLSASSFLVSVTGLIALWVPGQSALALLSDPAVATCYLLTVIPLTLAMFVQNIRSRQAFRCFLVLAADVTYLIVLGSDLGIFALAVEVLFFFLFYTRKTWTALLILLLALPAVSYFVWPDFTAFAEEIAASGRDELWSAIWQVVSQASFSGIGMSDSILLSAVAETTSVDLSLSNTALRLLVQIGVPGLLVFVLILVIWYAGGFTLLRKHGSQDKAASMYLALLSALTGLLIMGSLSYLWSDNRLLLLFWMSAGITRALQRVSGRSRGLNDLILADRREEIQYADVDLVFQRQNEKPTAHLQSSREEDAE